MVYLEIALCRIVPDELKNDAFSLTTREIQSEQLFPFGFYLIRKIFFRAIIKFKNWEYYLKSLTTGIWYF